MRVRGSNWDLRGTTSWAGIVNRRPAILCSYKGGATLWCFHRRWFRRGQWRPCHKFKDTLDAYERLGIHKDEK